MSGGFLLNLIPGAGPALSAAKVFLSANWKFVAVGVLVGLLAYQNFSATRFLFWLPTIPHLEQVVSEKDAEIKILKENLKVTIEANKNLTATIQAQNNVVDQWKAVSDKLELQHNAVTAQLNNMRRENTKAVEQILSGKTPETCEASIDYLREMRLQLRW